ncbi:MAG: hypothetical protein PUB93_03735 [Firmicutes bacterium]|nr:hypothetical protein [Bacillota bacterium]
MNEVEQNRKAEEPHEEAFPVNAHRRSKKRALGESAPNLPVKEVLPEPDEYQLVRGKCGGWTG